MENQITKLKNQVDQKISQFQEDLKTIRTSHIGSGIVENIIVSYYGTKVPLKKMAQITTPAPDKIAIIPWDKNALGDIETAIRNSDLNLNPVNDGRNVRITLPPLTEERRRDLVKMVKTSAEETKIAIRNIRGVVWGEIQKLERAGKVTEDDKYRGQDELKKIIAESNRRIDEITATKENEILKV